MRVKFRLLVYACAADKALARLWWSEVLWRHGKRWILTGRHCTRQGQRSARRGPLADDSLIIAGMKRPTGGPRTSCGVRRRSEPHCRSGSAATQGGSVQGKMPLVGVSCSGCHRYHLRKPERLMHNRNAGGLRVVRPVPSRPTP